MGSGRAATGLRRMGLLLAAGVLLAGCSGSADPVGSAKPPSASASAAPSASASPSPSSTLSAAEQQAFEEATAVVLAYRQTIADLYSGARTDLNDLDKVATGELLDRTLRNIHQGLAQGYRSEPYGVQLVLVSSELVKGDVSEDPQRLVVRACVDATAVIDVSPDGARTPGAREVSDYHLVMTDFLPDPGWAVERETADPEPEDRTC